MTAVTFLGVEEMGTALAATALAAEYRTSVCNRTPGRTAALEAHGATVADTAAGAIASADLVDASRAQGISTGSVDSVQHLIRRQIEAGHGADGFRRIRPHHREHSQPEGGAAALLAAGHRTTVWNRTESKAAQLLSRGAHWAPDPAHAVGASEVTLINVVDHDAVDSVVAAAGDSVDGRVIVGLSSDTPERARRTAKLVSAAGGRYLDGAIMTPTEVIGTPDARVLFAGPKELFDADRNVFEALGRATWLAEDHGRAAAFDMALLDVFWTATGGFLHAVKVAGVQGITPGELLPHALGIVDILPPIFTELAERVDADRHGDSSAPVSSVAASLGHLVTASRSAGVDAGALQVLKRYADDVVADGHGADEVSRLAAAMRG